MGSSRFSTNQGHNSTLGPYNQRKVQKLSEKNNVPYCTPFKKCFRNFKISNWEYFKSNLENYPQQINVVDCVEQVEREGLAYVESLYLLMDSVCPLRTVLPHKPMGWWINELQEMRKQVHILWRRREKTDLGGQLYKIARNDYNKAVDTAFNEGWKKRSRLLRVQIKLQYLWNHWR